MTVVIDRFEGAFAVCENLEDGKIIYLEKSLISNEAREGSVLVYDGKTAVLDLAGTEERTRMIGAKMDALWERRDFALKCTNKSEQNRR